MKNVDNVDNFVYKSKMPSLRGFKMWITFFVFFKKTLAFSNIVHNSRIAYFDKSLLDNFCSNRCFSWADGSTRFIQLIKHSFNSCLVKFQRFLGTALNPFC